MAGTCQVYVTNKGGWCVASVPVPVTGTGTNAEDRDVSENLVFSASAPGKVILFGEHAVVYGEPAIAVPLTDLRARVTVSGTAPGTGSIIDAVDIPDCAGRPGGLRCRLEEMASNDPLRAVFAVAVGVVGGKDAGLGDVLVQVSSDIPIGRGLGSGAAVATAIVRALAAFNGRNLTTEQVSKAVFETEKLFHGTPSGIDNTVIAYETPIFFARGQLPIRMKLPKPLRLVIGDAGEAPPTRDVVSFVCRRRQEAPSIYGGLFTSIGRIAREGRRAIEEGDIGLVGRLMNDNHEILQRLGVSSPGLDRLVKAAVAAGALGAKMSGAGWGGNMVALVDCGAEAQVASCLEASGADRVIVAEVGGRS